MRKRIRAAFEKLVTSLTPRLARAARSGLQAATLIAASVLTAKFAELRNVSDWSARFTIVLGAFGTIGMAFASAAWYSLFPPRQH